ncbi:helix-turn-helix domain-containing protein, partial [Nocardia brasiliensis]
MVTGPNTALRAARMGRLMSQDDLARALRAIGCTSANKRLVQRWESGTTRTPRPSHASALERVLGMPIEHLGFVMAHVADDGRGGHDVSLPQSATETITTTATRARPNPGNFSGIWLSHYQYYSSGRQETLSTGHYVVILQHGDHLTVRSLSGSAPSTVAMELDLDGGVATGTWTEDTDPNGYYRGARYSGAIQLLVEPTGHRLVGKWIGYGKNFDINSGPWEFVLQDASTSK